MKDYKSKDETDYAGLSTGKDIETDMAKVRTTWQSILTKIGLMSAGMKPMQK